MEGLHFRLFSPDPQKCAQQKQEHRCGDGNAQGHVRNFQGILHHFGHGVGDGEAVYTQAEENGREYDMLYDRNGVGELRPIARLREETGCKCVCVYMYRRDEELKGKKTSVPDP